MRTIKIISISKYNSGREIFTGPLSELSHSYLCEKLLDNDNSGESEAQAGLYELSRSSWLTRHKSDVWNNSHGSHYCAQNAIKELCLGDYI
jgi:hypothetical protein